MINGFLKRNRLCGSKWRVGRRVADVVRLGGLRQVQADLGPARLGSAGQARQGWFGHCEVGHMFNSEEGRWELNKN